MSQQDPLASLQAELRKFVAERDWDQFHSPKNVSMEIPLSYLMRDMIKYPNDQINAFP